MEGAPKIPPGQIPPRISPSRFSSLQPILFGFPGIQRSGMVLPTVGAQTRPHGWENPSYCSRDKANISLILRIKGFIPQERVGERNPRGQGEPGPPGNLPSNPQILPTGPCLSFPRRNPREEEDQRGDSSSLLGSSSFPDERTGREFRSQLLSPSKSREVQFPQF